MSDEVLSFSVNSVRHGQQIAALHDAFIGTGNPGDAATVTHSESRLLCKQVMNLTPTPGLGQDAKKRGEDRVKSDLMKLFTPIDAEFLNMVGSEFGLTGIDTWLTHPSGKHFELQWDRLDPSGNGMAAFHRANQDRRGRTTRRKKAVKGKWKAAYVVSFQDFGAYLKRIQARVGWRKSAWAKHLIALGGKVPKWIERHVATQPSQTTIGLEGNYPVVRMVSRAPGITDDERIVESAMRIRSKAMARRVKLILSGYAKDVKAGMIIGRKEHRMTDES